MTDARPGVGFLENRRRETTMSDKKWIKAEDVARLAGVSRSAVSRTFTPGASVSEKTRQKVLSAAEALGYQVNIIARTMITGSSNFIGIVTAGFDNPFRSKLLAPLVHQLALNGFMPLLMNADDPQQLAPSLKQLLSYHVAGVIITSGAPPLSLAEEYLARKIPVTLINRHADLAGCDRVCSDNAQGAKLVADLFSRRGWRQVGFIGENRENFSTRQRYEAFIARTSDIASATAAAIRPATRLPENWLLKTPGCRRCFAPPICWRWAPRTACGTPPPRCRPSSALTISRRRTGSPISSPPFSRIPPCWPTTRWIC